MNKLLDSLHGKILKSDAVEIITEEEIKELVRVKNYDIDNVVEELEKEKKNADNREKYETWINAIDIVKRGMKNDD